MEFQLYQEVLYKTIILLINKNGKYIKLQLSNSNKLPRCLVHVTNLILANYYWKWLWGSSQEDWVPPACFVSFAFKGPLNFPLHEKNKYLLIFKFSLSIDISLHRSGIGRYFVLLIILILWFSMRVVPFPWKSVWVIVINIIIKDRTSI